MAIPAAIVTVVVSKIKGIQTANIANKESVYATVRVGSRKLGRTKIIRSAGEFAVGWELKVYPGSTQTIDIEVDLYEDRIAVGSGPDRIAHIVGQIAPPWTAQTYTFGNNPGVECVVKTRPVPGGGNQSARVPRNATGVAPTTTTSAPSQSFCVEITEIKGLCKPGYAPGSLGRPVRLAEYCAGYTSEDHQGRIYLNRNLSGAWSKDEQCIELTARVAVSGGTLPGSAKLRWIMEDPDDPFDDQPGVHRSGRKYIDPNDWVVSDTLGATGDDNEGKPDKTPCWEQVGTYAISNVNATSSETTFDTNNVSKVRLHCPNVAGDNLIVRAVVVEGGGVPVFPAETGIMTMWQRIDVEYVRMRTALELPVDQIAPNFEPACTQIDVAAERIVDDKEELAPSPDELSTEAFAYADSVFTHKNDPGWFCLISARYPYSPPPAPQLLLDGVGAKLGRGTYGTGTAGEYVQVDGDNPNVNSVRLTWNGMHVDFNTVESEYIYTGDKTRIWLQPHDIKRQFVAGDGRLSGTNYYFLPTSRMEGSNYIGSGYGGTGAVTLKASNIGHYTGGISPLKKVSGTQYFAGRTLIFTATRNAGPDFAASAVPTIVHELTHAFGFPHKCGYWDYRSPRDKTCCMNYGNHWMVDESLAVEPGSMKRQLSFHCARHLKELRRTHVEDNVVLQW
jgi:hypothetical protein